MDDAPMGSGEAILLVRARSQAAAMVSACPLARSSASFGSPGRPHALHPASSTSPKSRSPPSLRQSRPTSEPTRRWHRLARQMLAGEGGDAVATDEAGLGAVESAQSEIALLTEQGGALVQAHPCRRTRERRRPGARSGPRGSSRSRSPTTAMIPSRCRPTCHPGWDNHQRVRHHGGGRRWTRPSRSWRVTQGGVGIVQIEDGKTLKTTSGSFHLLTIGASRVLVDERSGVDAHRRRCTT